MSVEQFSEDQWDGTDIEPGPAPSRSRKTDSYSDQTLAALIPDPVAKAIVSPDYVLEFRLPLTSKARPRLTKSGHAYMADSYRRAQAEMRRQVREQWPHPPLEGPLSLYIRVYGEARGDSDNIAGFFMDAAGPSKNEPGILWVDDRVGVISCLILEWNRAKVDNSRWVIQIASV